VSSRINYDEAKTVSMTFPFTNITKNEWKEEKGKECHKVTESMIYLRQGIFALIGIKK
jgi:hypothetical protein